MRVKKLIVLTQDGRPPTREFAAKLAVRILGPGNVGDLEVVAGLSLLNPQALAEKIDKKAVLAKLTVQPDGQYTCETIRGQELANAKAALAQAPEGATSWAII